MTRLKCSCQWATERQLDKQSFWVPGYIINSVIKEKWRAWYVGGVQVLTLQFSQFHADFEQYSFSKRNCILQVASRRLDESLDSAAQVSGQVRWVARNSTDGLSNLQCATVLTAQIFLNICPHLIKRIHSNFLLKAFLEESSLATTCSTVIRVFSSN